MSSELSYDVAPSFAQPLVPLTVPEGRDAILTCRVCGRPRPVVTWIAPDHTLIESAPHVKAIQYTDTGIATLHLEYVPTWMSGDYTCTITNDLGTTSTKAKVTVVNGE